MPNKCTERSFRQKKTHTINELGDMNVYVWRVIELVIMMSRREYVVVGWRMGFLELLLLTTLFRSLWTDTQLLLMHSSALGLHCLTCMPLSGLHYIYINWLSYGNYRGRAIRS